ncbi:MAG: cation diffusion facilitator family transporter [Bacteroidales bacterium]|nr:cation diffusion facilitator family transporter [Bacteroidales bacterium]
MNEREKQITKVTLVGSVVNLLLAAFKIIAGIFGRSGAMVADGVHSLSDLVSDVVVLVFIPMSSKGRDKRHKYGHGKFETLATLIVSIILIVVSAKLIIESINTIVACLQGEVLPVPSMIAFWAAVISILSKELLYQYTIFVGRKTESEACKANAWHHRSDALSSIGSLLGVGGAILLGEKWTILDPIAAFVIGLMILVVAVKMFKPPIDELMEKSLGEETEIEIENIILSTQGVLNLHNLKTRCNGRSKIIDCHIRVKRDKTIVEAHDIATAVERNLRERFGEHTQIGIHVEPEKTIEKSL